MNKHGFTQIKVGARCNVPPLLLISAIKPLTAKAVLGSSLPFLFIRVYLCRLSQNIFKTPSKSKKFSNRKYGLYFSKSLTEYDPVATATVFAPASIFPVAIPRRTSFLLDRAWIRFLIPGIIV